VVWLVSYPRSGNTFVRQVLFEVWGIPTFTVYPQERETQDLGGFIGDVNTTGLPVVFVKNHSLADYPGRS